MAKFIWGVDSAQKVTDQLYKCVVDHFSYPNYWGRYLTTVPNASDGLTINEIRFLKQKGVKILPIYNNFQTAIGYNAGQIVARNSIFHARRLGIPEGTVLFANIEKFFEVDEAWIRGWVETIYSSGYLSGAYHDPIEGNFNSSYCQAASNNKLVRDQLILWSAEPEVGTTGLRKAPKFNPETPACTANVWGWQYGRDSELCPIDTNLINKKLFNRLW